MLEQAEIRGMLCASMTVGKLKEELETLVSAFSRDFLELNWKASCSFFFSSAMFFKGG